ncbi:MAG: EFR1 family ferrodoxin [Clostridia bacterium]
MKKTVIFYFSGTGNTWWVANKINGYFNNYIGDSTIVAIDNVSRKEINEYIKYSEIIGFGYPIYGSDIPKPMKDFMLSMRNLKNKEILLFCTQSSFSGDGTQIAKKYLSSTNCIFRWAKHFIMPNNISVPQGIKLMSYTNDAKKINKILSKTDEDIYTFCSYILDNVTHLQDFNTFSTLLGLAQRPVYSLLSRNFNKIFSIDDDKCSCCGTCLKICPVNNISYKKSKYVIGDKCVNCMRCYNFCPKKAVTCMGKNHNYKYGVPYKGPSSKYFKELIERNTEID